MTTLLLGTRKGLVIFERRGNGWENVCEAFIGIPVSHATIDPRTRMLWACLDHGHWGQKLHRSGDLGATWQEIGAPKYPQPEGSSEGDVEGENKGVTVSYLWLVAPGGVDQPNRLYVGTEPGGLFQSDDGGETWALVEGLWNHPTREKWWFGGGRDKPGLCSIIVDPRDNKHLTIGISVGGVFDSKDAGKTWETRNRGLLACYLPDPHSEAGHDPHFIVASPSDPDVMWQQNHCGVFRTVDGGQQWTDISETIGEGPVRFGFAIAAHPKNAEVAWVVPATNDDQRYAVKRTLCVSRSEDGGKTWRAARKGLPQTNAYDLTFRHALALSGENGDQLAFGTTTGNVYYSNDGGDSWECVGNNLPPIYSVRFA